MDTEALEMEDHFHDQVCVRVKPFVTNSNCFIFFHHKFRCANFAMKYDDIFTLLFSGNS